MRMERLIRSLMFLQTEKAAGFLQLCQSNVKLQDILSTVYILQGRLLKYFLHSK